MEQMGAPREGRRRIPGVGGNLAKLRAILDLARTMQSSFFDRRRAGLGGGCGAGHHRRRARLPAAAHGRRVWRRAWRAAATARRLDEGDLRVPREVIHRALERRRELLYMNFDPLGDEETRAAAPAWIWNCAA